MYTLFILISVRLKKAVHHDKIMSNLAPKELIKNTTAEGMG